MPKLVLPRSPPSPRTLRANTSLSRRQYFISSPIRPLAQPQNGLLTEPSLPSNPTPTLFSATTPHPIPDGPSPSPDDHKPPDERILKLGKSTSSPSLFARSNLEANIHWRSPPHPLTPPPNPPNQPPPALHPRPQRNPAPLPIDTPSPPHRQRPHPLPRRALDRPRGLGQPPARR
jgi:hypothetical protein